MIWGERDIICVLTVIMFDTVHKSMKIEENGCGESNCVYKKDSRAWLTFHSFYRQHRPQPCSGIDCVMHKGLTGSCRLRDGLQ